MRRSITEAMILSLITLSALVAFEPARAQAQAPSLPGITKPELIPANQRLVIVMLDGFGVDYLEQSPMPNLKNMIAKGFYKQVEGVMPAVTNVNNASICCGVWPDEHG